MKRKQIKYSTRQGRCKTTLWLDHDTFRAIAAEAEERRVSKQSIMENSLNGRYSKTARIDRDAAVADRLNKLDRGQKRIEGQNETISEALALFVRMWLASTPEVPQEQRDIAVQSAEERYARYLRQLTKRLDHQHSTSNFPEVEVKLKDDDF